MTHATSTKEPCGTCGDPIEQNDPTGTSYRHALTADGRVYDHRAVPTPGDPGPMPADALTDSPEATRIRQIAAIHALAQWYADRPHIPMPRNVICATWTYSHDGPEADRVLAVLDFARAIGATPSETWEEVKVSHKLMEMHGMSVSVTHTARLSPSSANRYVR